MRTALRITLLLGALLLVSQQAGCMQAHQVRFREHLNASVEPSGSDYSLAFVNDE